MRVRMLETRSGTEDGYTIRRYLADEEYDLADGLARAFLAAGFAMPAARKDGDGPSTKNPGRKKAEKKRAPSSATKAGKAGGGKRRTLRLIKE